MYAPMYALFRLPRQAVKIAWRGILATVKQNVDGVTDVTDGNPQAPCARAACLGRDESNASKVCLLRPRQLRHILAAASGYLKVD